MADPLDSLRLALMQEVLPVGMAVVERARKGGPREVVEAFTASPDPLAQLKQEGDPAARAVRQSLDQIQPGLGNPVMKVEVHDVAPPPPWSPQAGDPAATGFTEAADPQREREALQTTLARISERLALLQHRLEA
jgi:hypothetical protein